MATDANPDLGSPLASKMNTLQPEELEADLVLEITSQIQLLESQRQQV